MTWTFVLVLAAGCYLTKLLGYLVPSSVLDRPLVQRVSALAPVGLLAALVLTQTLTRGSSFVLEPRAAGVAVGMVAVWLQAPFLVVVLSATATAALVRAVVGG